MVFVAVCKVGTPPCQIREINQTKLASKFKADSVAVKSAAYKITQDFTQTRIPTKPGVNPTPMVDASLGGDD